MKKVLQLYFLVISCYAYTQGEASNWTFGDGAGLSFNLANGTLTPVSSAISTNEGCSTISDASGELLFYTDGRTVWDRDNQIMPNANYNAGNGLLGDPSSTSSGLIVPNPANTDQYYIFTVDEPHHNNAWAFPNQGPADQNGNPIPTYEETFGNFQTVPGDDDGFNNGFNYSLVDLSLNNGFGDVVDTEKNVPLVTFDENIPEQLLYKSAEKITAVQGEDCNSFWVITHFVDSFYAFKIDENGVNNTPTVSTLSPTIITDGYRRNAIGYIKSSPNGEKLAICHSQNFNLPSNTNSSQNTGSFWLYDFDNATGVISNGQALLENVSAYGTDFSSDSNKLYVTSNSSVIQFDLQDNNAQTTVFQGSGFLGAIQLGPNNKIYICNTNSQSTLDVIENPQEAGLACNYNASGQSLGGNTANLGLPPFITSFFTQQINIIDDSQAIVTNLSLCEGTAYTLEAQEIPGATYTWFFEGALLPENDFDLEITESGFYSVIIDQIPDDCNLTLSGEATIQYIDPPEIINTTLFQCDEDGIPDGFTTFNLSQANVALTAGIPDLSVTYFFSLTDAENNENTLDENSFNNWFNPQVIYARVTNDDVGCFSISELSLEVSATGISDFEPTPLCDELDSEDGINTFNLATITSEIQDFNNITFPLLYYENYQDALLEVNPLANSYVNSNPYSQIIYARVENDNACYGIAEIQLTVNKLPQLEEDQTLLYCLNEFPNNMLTLSGGVLNDDPNNYYYEWFFNGTNLNEDEADITINEIGNYRVIVTTTAGCSKERLFSIEPSNIASIETIEVTDASENNTITVFVSGEGTYQFALDDPNGPYQDSTVFENVISGFHTVYVRDIKNDCGIVDALVSVIGFPRFFTPNGDSYNERWHVRGVSEQFQPNSKIQIFDRYGRLVSVLTPLGPGWDGTYNGENLPASDYWFAVTLQDGRTFKNHFTLKR